MKSKLSRAASDHRDTFDLEVLKAAAEVSRAILSNGGTENDALNASRQTARYKLLSSGGFDARRSKGVGRIISGMKLKKQSKEISRLATSLAMSDNWNSLWKGDDSEVGDSVYTDDVSYDVSTMSGTSPRRISPQTNYSMLGEFTSDIAGGFSILHGSVLKLAESYIQNHQELTSEHSQSESPETNTSANNKERHLEVSEVSLGTVENQTSLHTGKFGITSLCCTNSAKNYPDLVAPTFSAEESKMIEDSRNYEEDETKVENSKNDDSVDKEEQEKESLHGSKESMRTHTTLSTRGSNQTSITTSGSVNQGRSLIDSLETVEKSMELSNDSQFSNKSGSQSWRKRFVLRVPRRKKFASEKIESNDVMELYTENKTSLSKSSITETKFQDREEPNNDPIEYSGSPTQGDEVTNSGILQNAEDNTIEAIVGMAQGQTTTIAGVEKNDEFDPRILSDKEDMNISIEIFENGTMNSSGEGVETCVRSKDIINFPVELTENNTMSSAGKGIEIQIPKALLTRAGRSHEFDYYFLDDQEGINFSVDLFESSTMTSTRGGVETYLHSKDTSSSFPRDRHIEEKESYEEETLSKYSFVELTENNTMSSTGQGIETQIFTKSNHDHSHHLNPEESTTRDIKLRSTAGANIMEDGAMQVDKKAVENNSSFFNNSKESLGDNEISSVESTGGNAPVDQNGSAITPVKSNKKAESPNTGKRVLAWNNARVVASRVKMFQSKKSRSARKQEEIIKGDHKNPIQTLIRTGILQTNVSINDIEDALEERVEEIIQFSRIEDLINIVETSSMCSTAKDIRGILRNDDLGCGISPALLEESRDDHLNYSEQTLDWKLSQERV